MDELEETARAFDRLRDLVLAAIAGHWITADEAQDIRASLDRVSNAVPVVDSQEVRSDRIH